MREGEELVPEPFNRLMEKNLLMAYKYESFWRAIDTLRDRQVLEEMAERGEMPWRPSHDTARDLERKIELLNAHFGSQRSKDWFDPEVFRGLARLRGMECRAPEGYAEAFFARKVVLL